MDIITNEEMSPMLTIKQVATLLHVHVNTVRRWSDRGLIKSYQINHRGDRRFLQKDVATFLVEMNTKCCEQNNSLVV
jgi:excisionase family DNA binding protein